MQLEQHILETLYKHKGASPLKILFPEGENDKIQNVALKLMQETTTLQNGTKIALKELIEPILLFNKDETVPIGLQDKKITTLFMTDETKTEYANALAILRKDKGLTLDQAKKLIAGKNYYGMMMLHTGTVDCLVGGINYTSADIFRPALQIIKPKPHIKTISSCFVMNKDNSTFLFTDGSLNISPTAEQVVDITQSAIDFAATLKLDVYDPENFNELKVALLSYSTNSSGTGPDVDKMRAAKELLLTKTFAKTVHIAGEIQFDAAFDETTRHKKSPELNFSGPCNIYVFPDLNSANIGYKIAQRLGGYKAIGPIVIGLNKPVNDLSRGATVEDIYLTALLTCALTIKS